MRNWDTLIGGGEERNAEGVFATSWPIRSVRVIDDDDDSINGLPCYTFNATKERYSDSPLYYDTTDEVFKMLAQRTVQQSLRRGVCPRVELQEMWDVRDG